MHRDKVDWILGKIEGRSVLYIGDVDDDPGNRSKHHSIRQRLGSRVGALVVAGREPDLDRAFDAIVCADVIEHVSDAGRFLETLARHLAPDGVVLVSTPNPTGLMRILETLALGRTKANVEHSCWYSGQVLDQLARRHGLEVVSEDPIDDMHLYQRYDRESGVGAGKRTLRWFAVALNRIACTVFPQLSETSGFVLRRHDA